MLTTMQHCLEEDRGILGNLLSMNYKILFIILSEPPTMGSVATTFASHGR